MIETYVSFDKVYSQLLQKTLAPTNIFRDLRQYDNYLKYSVFLPFVNNEVNHPKQNQYKRRFEALNYLSMYQFTKDPIIYPRSSTFFGEISKDGQELQMDQTQVFIKNTFGLKTLFDEGRTHTDVIDGWHL